MSDALTYLQGDSEGPKRDLIARYYYEVAQGDPNSSPVAFAVLLDACAEQLGKAPEELRQLILEYRNLLAEGREMEARIRERVELCNIGVVASFKDEGARVESNLKMAAQHHAEVASESRQIVKATHELLVQFNALLTELRLIRDDLKINGESIKRIVEATENTKSSYQAIKGIVSKVTDAASVNWITVGAVIGFVLTIVAMNLSWWLALPLFALALGILQALGRAFWSSVKEEAQTIKADKTVNSPKL